MKKLFWLGFIGLVAFEILNVYFIMPMPGSQEMHSIDAAYFLYTWRWAFRAIFAVMLLAGLMRGKWKRSWLLIIPILIVGAVIYMANFKMAADHMFYQPKSLVLATATDNKVEADRLVLGVVENGQAKAYPIRFLGFHHQVKDTIGGKPVIVTYCTVCRTGRVYEPTVNGKTENFRLVGMDHFNAMFEDETTHSWWRQVSGEAITGKLKGQQLPEVFSTQTSLKKWLELNPSSLIMQADPAFIASYDTTMKYESGESRNALTGTDSLSWNKKSWVVGVTVNKQQKAYDWNKLKTTHIINDNIGTTPIVLALSSDNKSFFAFERPTADWNFTVNQDSLFGGGRKFLLNGKGVDTSFSLKSLPAYQEFWHSWQTFHPKTGKY
jgi:hypothetical protein